MEDSQLDLMIGGRGPGGGRSNSICAFTLVAPPPVPGS